MRREEKKREDYRKIYGKSKIPEGWEVHHIDFDKHNNEIDNLIAVPKEVHIAIHQSGYCDKQQIEKLIKLYHKHK